ncbi:MAG: UvrD-helicase domain-containing protein, partial [Candidatus Edwardsbacteria bacterium]|nr:UvrD-helicase domain-containing protein [Candidatus Edwardsbacteria bacterium]
RIMAELAIPERKVPVKAVISRISGAKDNLFGPERYRSTAYDPFEKDVARVYARYQEALLACQAMDFDDLIGNTVRLLREHPPVLEELGARFKQVLVDEYQDTNHAQYVLDGFRGADIKNILDFENDFADTTVVRLEQNYRSTKVILDCANAVVRNNLGRKAKQLWTENQRGDEVTLWRCWDERDEADKVSRSIRKHMSDGGTLRDCVVLYRTNAQSRALEEAMRRQSLPYVIVGGLRFYERKEVKDLLAYLKLIANPADEVSLRRIANEPPRGIGDTTLLRLEAFGREQGLGLYEAMRRSEDAPGLTPSARTALRSFVAMIDELGKERHTFDAEEVLKEVVQRTGFIKSLESQYALTDEATSRVENVQELLSAADEFCERSDDRTVAAFLAEVGLVADIDKLDPHAEAVTLMTLHNAKGLEFDQVFITGVEEGLLPHAASIESRQELEEERRLFYVGITRARRKLHLAFAGSRRRAGSHMPSMASRFLQEIPQDLLQLDGPATAAAAAVPPPERADQPGGYRRGQRVRHPAFGPGQVVEVEGRGEGAKLTIVFAGGIRKKIVAGYVEYVDE